MTPADGGAAGDWIAHFGGPCPVAPEALVETKLRDGQLGPYPASTLDWDHVGDQWGLSSDSGDIIAYRVVQP